MGERVTYPSNGGTNTGYLAVPDSGTGPGVVVIQEWWGLVPHIESLVDRFAEAGFVALAPDLYHGAQASEPDDAVRLLMGMAMDQAAKDIAGAADYLAGRRRGERTDRCGRLLHGRQPCAVVGDPVRADRRRGRLLPARCRGRG